ncbi:MAG: hypothetical protein E5W57_04155 [Mesorhizobium sp.]|nr:MAG: hypothetical protein E5W57_04155 [Mesorhizobium sp.]
MKIIAVDNLARETVADHLVIGWIPESPENRRKARELCDWLNSFSCDNHGGMFHKVVDNEHRLSRGMEDLI